MIQMTKKLFLAAVVTTSLNAATELSKNEVKQIENLELFKRAQISITKAYDIGNLYALKINVQGNNDQVFLTKDKKSLITGEVIDTESGASVSIPADLTGVRGKESFVYGSGTDEYFLFTDPECPYCKKFEEYFSQIEKNVKIRVFYYPLEMHKNAKDMSIYIMSKKTQKEKIDAMLNLELSDEGYKNRKYSKDELAKLEAQLAEQMEIATKLSVQGTPAVFDKDGKSVAWPNMLKKYGVDLK
ncbi:thioredoxin fold domain-containing protein [Poseidonibacter antarcticus]|uniref:thioredoxin fold domain-containing protein n=1 Tax=Poseidonibacter antarcticus TaxID=2478538 RepID=UPI000EF48E56|nr:thioredoxin fold domain-containing protein [Poseidonibacter antarcticus]